MSLIRRHYNANAYRSSQSYLINAVKCTIQKSQLQIVHQTNRGGHLQRRGLAVVNANHNEASTSNGRRNMCSVDMNQNKLESSIFNNRADFRSVAVDLTNLPGSRGMHSKSNDDSDTTGSDDDDTDDISINKFEGIDSKTREDMSRRHQGIVINPDSISQHILPGNCVVKTNSKTGTKKMVYVERNYGYFWTLKDLRKTNNKPVLSNEEAIPTDIAQVFPPLGDISDNLTTLTGEVISLPEYFTRNNRSMDASAQCTLVAVNFNEFGYKMLPSWIDPFRALCGSSNDNTYDSNRINVVNLHIQEGRMLRMLKSFILSGHHKNIPEEHHEHTLTFFGSCPDLRDLLRMHNDKTGYVYLLDGKGRVRFAGSGVATQDDIKKLTRVVKEITPNLKGMTSRKGVEKGGRRKNFRRNS